MKSLGLEDESIGAFLTVTLIGDSVVSLFVTGNADRMGRKFMLILGSVLMAGTGLAFALYPTFRLVVIGTIGVLSPSGNEVGPFVAMETSILSKYARLETRATLFSWYSLVGSFSTAIGSLFAGELISTLTERGSGLPYCHWTIWSSWNCLTLLFWKLSLDVETDSTAKGREVSPTRSIGTAILDRLLPGLNFSPDTRWLVIKLSMLFTLDSFGTSIMTGSMLAYWFSYKYNVDEAYLGEVLFVSNILAGFSSLLAGWVSSKVGMVNCMVFTTFLRTS
ncbi:MFS general substrate transporter [Rhizoclosmatium globosum]|uniref:MFS general substrate transporter n=1 Tax=Rhizoclosmatium globosum TaxID=329046 RepID=A0A1Y2CBU9_9FUNG|nr:MFS general substrate transporter [Rhizoclosmatium globosum]|eukprot:ORY44531.1 MFS general substrate transporter [Rhizoclosmatium globosum]